MGEILTFSQSSLLKVSRSQLGTSRQVQLHVDRRQAFSVGAVALSFVPTRLKKVPTIGSLYWEVKTVFFRDSKMPTTFPVVSAGTGSDILPDSGGPNDNFSGGGGVGGVGGGGSGNGGNNDRDKGGPDENDGQNSGDAKKVGMSMSQKLTLGYAALVAVGGAMGYIKGGSTKSLISGGLSALVLCTVYSILPTNPVLASSLGLGLSCSLLVVMGSRFKRSGKIFPAGVVSLVSLVMSAGYLHGILRSMH
ncbi:hypothetical protein F511_06021 [Dorcoceras hygrometricum]|uniref:Protein FATTY ACID EXPORT 2, chloroplastic-like n=1 Tax=Dorcoceras hygrometricum TaxID=472368 RepID=A0A2Z7AW75_9LAMI|nr:hypothetical protein F511_06021 [Dorcoceras hygrometricum]